MFVSVTRLRIRRLLDLPKFLWHTRSAEKQASKATGFLGGKLLVDRRRTYWTLTGWENEKAMKAYRGAGAHGAVMKRLPRWCDEAAYTHWESTDSAIPTWDEAYERLKSSGKLSRVEHPTPAHESREFPAPRLQPLVGSEIKPKPE
jgi:heme-degrading monooxygenase HmoA